MKHFRTIRHLAPILLLALLCLLQCGAVPAYRRTVVRGVVYANLRDLAAAYGLTYGRTSQWVELSRQNIRIILKENNRKLLFNGLRIELNYAPLYSRNGLVLAIADWEKTLLPLLDPGSLFPHRISRITIDMGHGGKDPGAQGRFSQEKNINLRLGRRLAEILQNCGYRVALTRSRDVYIPLEQVGKIQRSHQSDLFVSLHINSAKDRSLSGIETFCLTPYGAPSSNAGKSQKNVSYPGNRFDANNLALAAWIQRAMLRRTQAVDRGIKHARFIVLRDISVPGVLIESGFLSNSVEEQRLNSPAYLEKIARGIAEGIINYQRCLRSR